MTKLTDALFVVLGVAQESSVTVTAIRPRKVHARVLTPTVLVRALIHICNTVLIWREQHLQTFVCGNAKSSVTRHTTAVRSPVHVSPGFPVNPALHRQSDLDEAGPAVKLFNGQFTQLMAPDLYVFFGQATEYRT